MMWFELNDGSLCIRFGARPVKKSARVASTKLNLICTITREWVYRAGFANLYKKLN